MATEWILQELPLEKILNHEVNLSIYGTKIDDDLVKSIEKIGVTHPIHVVKHKGGSFVCLSGHRRKQHAQIAGLTKINCLVARQEMTEAEQVVFLCESNRQRTKTTEQLARETEALSEAYGTVAKERQKRGKKTESDLMKNVSQGRAEDNLAITQAAKETGIGSRPTAEKAIEVVHAIDAATEAGDTETAEELRETLNNKSVRAAHEKATGKPAKHPKEKTAPEIVDHFKKPVGEVSQEAFATLPEFRQLLTAISTLKKDAKELADGPGGLWIDRQDVERMCDELRRAVRFGQPYTECGRCRRDPKEKRGCQSCKGRGWICETAYNTQSQEDKDWIESR